MNRKEKQ